MDGVKILVKSPIIIRNNQGLHPRVLAGGLYVFYITIVLTKERRRFYAVKGTNFSLGLFAEELEVAKEGGMVEIQKGG